MTNRLPAVSSVPPQSDSELYRFLNTVKEHCGVIDGSRDPLAGYVSLADLVELGLITLDQAKGFSLRKR